MPVLDLWTPDKWILAALLATAGKTTTLNGATVPADATALVADRIYKLRDDVEPTGWPYIVWSDGSANFDNYAESVTLLHSDYIVRGVHREDKVTDGSNVEIANHPLYVAIFAAFDGVTFQSPDNGIVHSCQIVAPFQRLYGESERKVSEMGVTVRLISN